MRVSSTTEEQQLAILKALADKRRLEIMKLLIVSPRNPVEIAERLGITRQAVEQHLRKLEDAKLVERSTLMGRVVYQLTPTGWDCLQRLGTVTVKPQTAPVAQEAAPKKRLRVYWPLVAAGVGVLVYGVLQGLSYHQPSWIFGAVLLAATLIYIAVKLAR